MIPADIFPVTCLELIPHCSKHCMGGVGGNTRHEGKNNERGNVLSISCLKCKFHSFILINTRDQLKKKIIHKSHQICFYILCISWHFNNIYLITHWLKKLCWIKNTVQNESTWQLQVTKMDKKSKNETNKKSTLKIA